MNFSALRAPAGWSTATLLAGYALFLRLREPDAGWLPTLALWVAMLYGVWRAVNEYDEMPANEPVMQRAAGWMMMLSGLLVIGLIGWVCLRDSTAVPWPETQALVVEAETHDGQPWLAFAHETRGRQYMSAPFPAGKSGMWRAGSRYAVRFNPQQPAQIDPGGRPPAQRTEKLFIVAAVAAAVLLRVGLKQARTLLPAPVLTNRRREAIRQS